MARAYRCRERIAELALEFVQDDAVVLVHGGGQTRHSWDGTARVLAERGFRAITIDAAYQIFADNIVGSLEVGKQADLVVLEKNPRKTPPAEIRNIKVNGTWIDGKQVSLK